MSPTLESLLEDLVNGVDLSAPELPVPAPEAVELDSAEAWAAFEAVFESESKPQ